jgi:hypothetical protein
MGRGASSLTTPSESSAYIEPFSLLSTAARMGFVANDTFLRQRLLPPSRYRRGRAWAPALLSAPRHQPPHRPG